MSDISKFIGEHKKGIYVFMWATISLLSSYNSIIKGDFSFLSEDDFSCKIVTPL